MRSVYLNPADPAKFWERYYKNGSFKDQVDRVARGLGYKTAVTIPEADVPAFLEIAGITEYTLSRGL